MRRAADLAQFARSSTGRYLAGRCWLHWCQRPTLFGLTLWGSPDEADLQGLVASLRVELGSQVPPHVSLVDARRVEQVDPSSFKALLTYVTTHHAALQRQVTRLALVRPEGLSGAVVAGFFQVMQSPYPTKLCVTVAEAAQWLGAGEGLSAALDELHREVTGVDPIVAQLRALARERPGSLEVAQAAKALALSSRTLQRRLSESGTTFQAEVQSVRVSLAQERLLASDASLTAISADAGFASLQHFSSQFKKATGQSPGAWRQKQRG